MKIAFTGGGTGGHFYPLIAVAEAVHDVVKAEGLLEPTLIYMAPEPYDKKALFENKLLFKSINAGKVRRYFSPENILDALKTVVGIFEAFFYLFKEYPDVIFSKGGYVSFPIVTAARFLRIPVVIHESDSIPGRVNKHAAKHAESVAISYAEAAQYFPKDKVALTGNPIRKALLNPPAEGAIEFLKMEPGVPVILVLGGSQGADVINQLIVDMLPKLVSDYQIIHQTGENNIDVVRTTSNSILLDNPHKDRYKPFAFLTPVAMRMAAGAASMVISRAGSTLFEIAHWGLPCIIIPIPSAISRDQEKNAFSYSRSGAGFVVSQANLSDDILLNEIHMLMDNPEKLKQMSEAAKAFDKPGAAEKIAKQLIAIGLRHEH